MSDEIRFIVRRLGWHQAPHGDAYTRRLPTAEPVAHFDNFDEAEYHRRALEAAARADENPFRFGGAALFFQTSLDGPRLHDWLLDGGIDPPVTQLRHTDWKDWWDAFAHTWNADQLAHAWHGLDKVRFFDVAEELPGELFHVVLEQPPASVATWGYDSPAAREGGVLTGVYRRERSARAARPRRPDRDWPRDVVAVPGNVPPFAGVGFLVRRQAFGPDGLVCRGRRDLDAGQRVPVRVFADRPAATAYRDEFTAAARAAMNPFHVYAPGMAGLGKRQLAAVVEALGPPLPCPADWQPAAWREWWDLCQDEITPAQRAAVWELFADHPLFEVLRVEVIEE